MWTVMTEALRLLQAAANASEGSPQNLGAATPCSQWTVSQVLQHAAGDQLAWAAALGTGPGPAANPFEPSGSIECTVGELLAPALAAARTAWAGVAADTATVPTPLPQGALPPATAAAACALDASVHAWDIAMGLGLASPLGPDLAARLLPAARAIVEPLRGYGAYAEALPAQDGDDAAAELLRYLGRDPRWLAARRS